MNTRILLLLFVSLALFSCKKKEQSCHDGIFDEDKEEQTDCGGVCPPCNFTPTVIENIVHVKIKDKAVTFSDCQLVKSPTWKLRFKNDTIDIRLNFGTGDTVGGRPIQSLDSYGIVKNASYPILTDGLVLFSEVDTDKKFISGYFQATMVTNYNTWDTLFLTGGEFKKVKW